jgi:regulator of protease activity HflC (stomatin/prohibitin superfamily)
LRIVVPEWQRVLVYKDGRFTGELGPGRHRVPRRRHEAVRVTVRPRVVVVPAQEVLTADGLSVKVSLTATGRTADPRRWHEAVEDPDAFVYLALQVALRDAVATRTLDEVLAARAALPAEMLPAAAATAATVGVELTDLAVRDVMVPAELRHAAAEVATARSRGQAALERARAEVAATRALANAARLTADHPGLLALRTLQAIETGGATVVLRTDDPPAPAGAGRQAPSPAQPA